MASPRKEASALRTFQNTLSRRTNLQKFQFPPLDVIVSRQARLSTWPKPATTLLARSRLSRRVCALRHFAAPT